MQKARSRLTSPLDTASNNSEPTWHGSNPIKKSDLQAKKYIQHLPLLGLSCFFYFLTYYLLTNVYPGTIKHFLLPNSYLPLLFVTFCGTFFGGSFLFLHTRRGIWLSVTVVVGLFLQLQHVVLAPYFALMVLIIFGILELLLTFFDQKG